MFFFKTYHCTAKTSLLTSEVFPDQKMTPNPIIISLKTQDKMLALRLACVLEWFHVDHKMSLNPIMTYSVGQKSPLSLASRMTLCCKSLTKQNWQSIRDRVIKIFKTCWDENIVNSVFFYIIILRLYCIYWDKNPHTKYLLEITQSYRTRLPRMY